MARVKYIGNKRVHIDRFKTHKVWNGHGDIVEVEDERLARILCSTAPRTYQMVEGDGADDPVPDIKPENLEFDVQPEAADIMIQEIQGQMVDLPSASRAAMARYLEGNKISVLDTFDRREMIPMIVAVEKMKTAIMRAEESDSEETDPEPDAKEEEVETDPEPDAKEEEVKVEEELDTSDFSDEF